MMFSRRSLMIILGLFGLSLAWCAYWYVMSAKAQQFIAKERQQLKSERVELTCGQEVWKGFPFQFKWGCQKFSLVDDSRAVKASASDVTIHANAYNPFKIMATVVGPSRASAPGMKPLNITHDPALVTLSYNLQKLGSLVVNLPNAIINNQIKTAQLNVSLSNDGQLALATVEGEDITVIPPGQAPLHVQTFAAGIHLPAALLLASDIVDEAARTAAPLTIEKISLTEGDADFGIQGQINLDQQRKLNGTLAFTSRDIKAFLAYIAKPLRLNAGDLAAIQASLMFAGKNKDGVTEIKVTLTSGEARWGEMVLGKIPPLR